MRETRGKTEKEQRKNKETRRICSLTISRQIRQIGHPKKREFILVYSPLVEKRIYNYPQSKKTKSDT
jgi:hypothetical protein